MAADLPLNRANDPDADSRAGRAVFGTLDRIANTEKQKLGRCMRCYSRLPHGGHRERGVTHLRRHGISPYAIEDKRQHAFLGWVGLGYGHPRPDRRGVA